MGDTDAPSTENTDSCDISKPSIDILKAAKSSENIAITDKIGSSTIINVETTLKSSVTSNTDAEQTTQVEKLKNEVDVGNVNDESNKSENEVLKLKEKAALRNKSDIFGVNANVNTNQQPVTIFSVGGAPSKNIHKTTSINSDKTSSNDTIQSNASKQCHFRNPVTGIGVSSNDEFKNKPSKRKDGNPLLGVGYKDDDQFFNSPPPTRIPPGGYSKGLW